MDWVKGFLIPIIEVIFIGGIASFFGFYIFRGLYRTWKQQIKWILKYNIPFIRKPMPEKTILWCMDAIDKGIGFYDVKKILFIENHNNMDQVYETLFIYDKIIKEMHHKKNLRTEKEVEKGRKFERNFNKIVIGDLPKIE